jgi:hypothetical protein
LKLQLCVAPTFFNHIFLLETNKQCTSLSNPTHHHNKLEEIKMSNTIPQFSHYSLKKYCNILVSKVTWHPSLTSSIRHVWSGRQCMWICYITLSQTHMFTFMYTPVSNHAFKFFIVIFIFGNNIWSNLWTS